jgi:hypothetical protein
MSTKENSAVSMYPSVLVPSSSGSLILEIRPRSPPLAAVHRTSFIAARMPNKIFFQTTYPYPSQKQMQSAQPDTGVLLASSSEQMDNKPNDATSALAEAIDDFLGDLERKFKTVSDEILTRRKVIERIIDMIEADWRAGWRLTSPQWTIWPSVAIALRRSC